jgi:hypothetical protein
MIARYRLLAERIRAELRSLTQVLAQVEGGVRRAEEQPDNQSYFMAAAAFELHSAYSGIERIFELIAGDVDQGMSIVSLKITR